VVCNSQATFQWLSDAQASLKKKMRVIWNGVHPPTEIDQNVAAEMQLRFRPDNAQLAIGLVGRINRWKGHRLLMDAIDILYNKGLRDFSVIFMGSPAPGQENLEGELRQRIASSPMRNQILLQGFSSEIWPAYAALDIVCVPSTEPEPFGLVAVEAMASGKPVVASRFGGLTEIVVDGITGLTFNPRDAHALATALETLLHDDALRARLGRAGKERFDAEFSISPMIEHFASTYTEMMAARK
jgi:glycosyltransferase involved in cell wall biosynthesis